MTNSTRSGASFSLAVAIISCTGAISIAQEIPAGKGVVVFHVDAGCAILGTVAVSMQNPAKQWVRLGRAKYNRDSFFVKRDPYPATLQLPTGTFAIFEVTCGVPGGKFLQIYRSETALAMFSAEAGKVLNAGMIKIIPVEDREPKASIFSLPKLKFDVAVGPMPKSVYDTFKEDKPDLARAMITRQMIGRPRAAAPEKKK